MACFFSKRLNGAFSGSFKSGNAAGCTLPKYLWNGQKNIYLVCDGDFMQCPVKDRHISISLANYWDSEERKNHQMLRDQANVENGIKS